MANPNIQDQLEGSENLVGLSNQIIDSLNQRSKLIKGLANDEKTYLGYVKQQQKISEDILANAEKYQKSQFRTKDLTKQITKIDEENNKKQNAFDQIKDKLADKRKAAVQTMIQLNRTIQAQQDSLQQTENDIADIEVQRQIAVSKGDANLAKQLQQQLQGRKDTARVQEQSLQSSKKEFERQQDISKSIREILRNEEKSADQKKKELEFLNEQLRVSKQIDKTMGLSGAAIDAVIGGLGKLGISSERFKDIKDDMRETAKSSSKWKTAMTGIKGLAAGIGEALTDPLFIINAIVKVAKFFVDLMFAADKQVTDIAKGLVISKDAARGVLEEFRQISKQAEYLAKIPEGFALSAAEIITAGLELNKIFGTTANFTDQMNQSGRKLVAQFAFLNKALALTEEEQKGILNLNIQTGQEVQKISEDVLGTAALYKARTGYQINERKVMSEVLTTSNFVKMSIQGGTKALKESVINAQHLGISMQKVSDISSNMLNFESSIQDQMEAELFTNKQINLDRLRYAALTGDVKTQTEEINRLVKAGGAELKGNTLKTEAYAKALGISKEELADMVNQQEILNKTRYAAQKLSEKDIEKIEKANNLTEETKKALRNATIDGAKLYTVLKNANYSTEEITKMLGDQAEQALASRSAQDKFNDALSKAKEIFARFVDGGALDKLADAIVDIVDFIQGTTGSAKEARSIGADLSKKAEKQEDKDKIEQLVAAAQKEHGWWATTMAYLGEYTAKDRATLEENKAAAAAQEQLKNMTHKDFTIKSLPEDTIVAQGGTKLGRTDEMVTLLTEQNKLLAALLAKNTTIQVDGQTLANTVAKNVPTSYGNLLNPSSRVYGG